MAAPMQGYTQAVFRHYHAALFNTDQTDITYYSPFIRIEKGMPRKRDINDITSPLNNNHTLIPQIICRDCDEFRVLVETIKQQGYNDIDLNMGCPFPPQVKHGRGRGLMATAKELESICRLMNDMEDTRFSIKMRLGITRPDEWKQIIHILNEMPLQHITVHPRTATQQYRGELHINQLETLMHDIRHNIVYNGEITSPEQIITLQNTYPGLYGVMVGRGLLNRPTIFSEYTGIALRGEAPYVEAERNQASLRLLRSIIIWQSEHLCGTNQILAHAIPMALSMSENILDHKTIKQIKKVTSVQKLVDLITLPVV